MEKKTCKKCGYDLFPLDEVCDRCGTPCLSDAKAVKKETVPAKQLNKSEKKTCKRKEKKYKNKDNIKEGSFYERNKGLVLLVIYSLVFAIVFIPAVKATYVAFAWLGWVIFSLLRSLFTFSPIDYHAKWGALFCVLTFIFGLVVGDISVFTVGTVLMIFGVIIFLIASGAPTAEVKVGCFLGGIIVIALAIMFLSSSGDGKGHSTSSPKKKYEYFVNENGNRQYIDTGTWHSTGDGHSYYNDYGQIIDTKKKKK